MKADTYNSWEISTHPSLQQTVYLDKNPNTLLLNNAMDELDLKTSTEHEYHSSRQHIFLRSPKNFLQNRSHPSHKANLKYNNKQNNPLNPNRQQWDKIRNKCQRKLQKSFKPMKITLLKDQLVIKE
jgi:hypothetical protein